MKGNVAEWVSDPEYDHRKAAAVDPIGDHSVDGSRGTRGGGWGHNSVGLVVPLRVATQPGERRSHIGFRVARTPRDSGRGDPR